MRLLVALFALCLLTAGSAKAQVAFLTGSYQYIQNCQGPSLAYVTQAGWDLNLVNEAGVPSRAWIDWRGHIWAENWNMGAVYSADGFTIQFDNGTVWQRYVPPPPVLRRRG